LSLFCGACGSSLKPNLKFCTSCGAVIEPRLVEEHLGEESTGVLAQAHWVIVGLIAVSLIGGALFYALAQPKAEICGHATTTAAAGCGDAAAVIDGTQKTLYVVADANVRERATAIEGSGSAILRKVLRGTSVSGVIEIGEDGQKQWLKLTEGGFVSLVNLSNQVPPPLAQTFANRAWQIEVPTDLLERPDATDSFVGRLDAGNRVFLAGVTENGYAEVKRAKGGVGYFLITPATDSRGALGVTVAAPTPPLSAKNTGSARALVAKCQASPNLAGDTASLVRDAENELKRAYDAAQKDGSMAFGEDVGIEWRCKDGRVLACANAFGAGGQKCIAPDPDRAVTVEMLKFCHENPGINMFTFNRYSLWDWQCVGMRPTIKGARYAVDNSGYLADEWVDVTNVIS
jgi:hypothetical protein